MQLLAPLITEVVLILSIAQTESLQLIIKSFAALGFVIKIDDMFSANFPSEIKAAAQKYELLSGKD
jgi:hypothetical protein